MLVPVAIATSLLAVLSDDEDPGAEDAWRRAVAFNNPKIFIDWALGHGIEENELRFGVRDWICASPSLDDLEVRATFGISILDQIPRAFMMEWTKFYDFQAHKTRSLLSPAGLRYDIEHAQINGLTPLSQPKVPVFGGKPAGLVQDGEFNSFLQIMWERVRWFEAFKEEDALFYLAHDIDDMFPGEKYRVFSWDESDVLVMFEEQVQNMMRRRFEKIPRSCLTEVASARDPRLE
jgi:hypothetical protein